MLRKLNRYLTGSQLTSNPLEIISFTILKKRHNKRV